MYYAKPIQDNLLVLLKNYKSKPILNKINLKIPINHVNFYEYIYIYIFIKNLNSHVFFNFHQQIHFYYMNSTLYSIFVNLK